MAQNTMCPPVQPLSPDTFATLMAPFAPVNGRLALAVSGGPDSMALALCVQRVKPDSLALIVDHALRPESQTEALQTQERLKKIGLESKILRWNHLPITRRLHAEARKARYALLFEACHQNGIYDLLFAHQKEDQAETILMRFAKGSGVEGLAGIPVIRHENGIRILRPFLSIEKQALIATCQAVNIAFITDPSNLSPHFARGRLRAMKDLLATEGLTQDRLIDTGARAAEAHEALCFYTNQFLETATYRDSIGGIHFSSAPFHVLPKAIGLRAMAEALQAIHPTTYPPERASLLSLYENIKNTEKTTPHTLQGCLITHTHKEIHFFREPAAITETKNLMMSETSLWDQRWHVTYPEGFESPLTLRALGNTAHSILDNITPTLRKKIPQGRRRAGLPSLWKENNLVAIPITTARLQGVWPPTKKKTSF